MSTGGQVSLKRVLVATDFSPPSEVALKSAVTVARRYNSRIYLAHVTPPETYKSVPREIINSAVQRNREHVRNEMSHLIHAGGLTKIRHRILLEEGDTVEVLLRLVRDHDIDLVVIGTRGLKGMKKMLLGSVAEKVFRQAPCPVLIVPSAARDWSRTYRILYPTDFSQHSLQALPYALSLARHHQAKLILLHVVQEAKVPSVADLNHHRTVVKRRLQESVLGRTQLGVRPELEVEFGEPARKIRKVASEWQVDLIVLAVRSAKPAVAHLDEGIAYRVVHQAPCPVLAVR